MWKQGIVYPPMKEQVAQPLYDSATFQSMPQRQMFFERPIGQIGSDLKTKEGEDTNAYLSHMLPIGLEFFCTSIGVYFVPDCDGSFGATREQNVADVLTVLGQGVLDLTIQSRRYIEIAPLAAMPCGFPMYWAHDDARLEEMFKGQKVVSGEGVPTEEKLYEGFKIVPLYIPSQTYFHVEVRFKQRRKLNSVGKLGVMLYGILTRHAL